MRTFLVCFIIVNGFSGIRNENTTTTTTTTVPDTTSNPSAANKTIEDQPVALPFKHDHVHAASFLQRSRREPPFTIYKHRSRVSKRRPKPRRRIKSPKPVYGPPSHSFSEPISFYKPHVEFEESSTHSFEPSYTYENPKHTHSHSNLDVSSDFNIHSIPFSNYGPSPAKGIGSYEEVHDVSYDTDSVAYQPDSYSYSRPVEKKKPKKHYYEEPPIQEEPIGYSYDPPSDSFSHSHESYELPKQQETGTYSFAPPSKSFDKPRTEDSISYSYDPPAHSLNTPHETYGVPPPPPPQPPASSYGYPVRDDIYSAPPEPSGGLHGQPPPPPTNYYNAPPQEPDNKHPQTDYLPPDSTYSHTTNQNSYDSALPSDKKAVRNFAEPPPQPDIKNELHTSHFPLEQDHLASTYGSPKSSYEVPIYDAIPFTTPTQEYYPPNLPTSYNQNNFHLAKGSNKVEVLVTQKNRTPDQVPRNHKAFDATQINNLHTLSASLEQLAEPSPDYLDELIATHSRRPKRKHKSTRTPTSTRHTLDADDLQTAFSLESKTQKHQGSARSKPNSNFVLLSSTNNPGTASTTTTTSSWNPIRLNRDTKKGPELGKKDSFNVISIQKSHSQSFYGGTVPPQLFQRTVNNRPVKHHGFNSRQDAGEISVVSAGILVSGSQDLGHTRKGTVFDDPLDVNRSKIWNRQAPPRNHKFSK